MCVNNLPKIVTWQCPGAELNLRLWVTSRLQVRHVTVKLPSHTKHWHCPNTKLTTNSISGVFPQAFTPQVNTLTFCCQIPVPFQVFQLVWTMESPCIQ